MKMNQKKKSGHSYQKQAAVGWMKDCQKSVSQNWNPNVVPKAAIIPRRTRRGI